jgi:hypothetical protein
MVFALLVIARPLWRRPLWRRPLWRRPLWHRPLWRRPLWRRPLWRRPLWRGWVAFTLACGLLPMVVMPFFGIGLTPQSVFSAYARLFERVATNADTIWGLAILVRLWTWRSIGV